MMVQNISEHSKAGCVETHLVMKSAEMLYGYFESLFPKVMFLGYFYFDEITTIHSKNFVCNAISPECSFIKYQHKYKI